MKVILLKNAPGLGVPGDTIDVKPGHARNYLIPKRIALEATTANAQQYALLKRKQTKVHEKEKREAEDLKSRLEKVSLTLAVELKSEEEIYGSVSAQAIAQALTKEGIDLDKDAVVLAEPLRKIGVYTLEAKLHPEVIASFKVWIVKK